MNTIVNLSQKNIKVYFKKITFIKITLQKAEKNCLKDKRKLMYYMWQLFFATKG